MSDLYLIEIINTMQKWIILGFIVPNTLWNIDSTELFRSLNQKATSPLGKTRTKKIHGEQKFPAPHRGFSPQIRCYPTYIICQITCRIGQWGVYRKMYVRGKRLISGGKHLLSNFLIILLLYKQNLNSWVRFYKILMLFSRIYFQQSI